MKRWDRILIRIALSGLVVLGVAACSKVTVASRPNNNHHPLPTPPGTTTTVSTVTVTNVTPPQGYTTGGTAITITGTGFAVGATVTIGAHACTNVVVVSSTEITCVTPAGSAGAVTVSVTNTDGGAGSLTSGYAYIIQSYPVPGFVIAAGGGIETGTGMKVQTTIGQPGHPMIQSGTGMKLYSGFQGVDYDGQ